MVFNFNQIMLQNSMRLFVQPKVLAQPPTALEFEQTQSVKLQGKKFGAKIAPNESRSIKLSKIVCWYYRTLPQHKIAATF